MTGASYCKTRMLLIVAFLVSGTAQISKAMQGHDCTNSIRSARWEVQVQPVSGETFSSQEVTTIKHTFEAEQKGLLTRVESLPCVTVALLETVELLKATRALLLLKPSQSAKVIGIVGQVASNGRSLVLFDLSRWIELGRPERTTGLAIAVLPDADLHRSNGVKFVVAGASYVARYDTDGEQLGFYRVPTR